MIYLNDDAIKYAVSICRERPNYKVGIITAGIAKIQSVYDVLRCTVDECDCRMRKSINSIQITFNNGSTIIVVHASENMRGYKMHLLIIDEFVDDRIVEQVLLFIESLEDYDRGKRMQERENRRLDRNTGRNADCIIADEIIGGEIAQSYIHQKFGEFVPFGDEFVCKNDEKELAIDIDEEEFMRILETNN